MASLTELYDVAFNNNGTLTNKITAAGLVQAEAVRVESGATPNHAARLQWANRVMADPQAMGVKMLRAVLAQHAALTVAQINNASDAAILTSVANAIDVFATGEGG